MSFFIISVEKSNQFRLLANLVLCNNLFIIFLTCGMIFNNFKNSLSIFHI